MFKILRSKKKEFVSDSVGKMFIFNCLDNSSLKDIEIFIDMLLRNHVISFHLVPLSSILSKSLTTQHITHTVMP